VTVQRTQRGYIHPATHFASNSADPSLPPMGLRLRLKASFSLAGYRGEALVVLRALKRYGLVVADNGSSWYITGAPDPRWSDEDLDQLKRVPGSAFEALRADRSCIADRLVRVRSRIDRTPAACSPGYSAPALRLSADRAGPESGPDPVVRLAPALALALVALRLAASAAGDRGYGSRR
jgi:hypothetical protein